MHRARPYDPQRRKALLRELRQLAEALRRDLGARQVILFGSLARGDWHELSDIDLLVVVERLEGRALDAIGEVMRRTPLPVDPLVVRAETLERRLEADHPLFRHIVAEGIDLLSDEPAPS